MALDKQMPFIAAVGFEKINKYWKTSEEKTVKKELVWVVINTYLMSVIDRIYVILICKQINI